MSGIEELIRLLSNKSPLVILAGAGVSGGGRLVLLSVAQHRQWLHDGDG
jgi:hypothetical protein